ncbi:VOC family protein [Nocardia sp. NBC_00511]|uniref:VOC family protein n=1 Tax=Nocardia sp. NBC_00511 TaxID=2903591 RepID=UPI0030E5ACF6
MSIRLNVIEIVVADMAAALAFYRRLGLEFPEGSENEPHLDIELAGGIRLAFDTEDTIRSFKPEWKAVAGAGRMAIAFQCDSPGGVDAKFQEMMDAGYHGEMKPFDAFWGQRYAVVHDPDGNGIDLYATMN